MDFAAARRHMVDSQIRPAQVSDPRVLAALAEVPREAFVPRALQGVAYVDEDVPLGNDRFLIEPLVIARLLQAAEIKAGDVVLDIGCASGYSAALLARLAGTVVALESDPALAAIATATLLRLAIDTVAVVGGPLEKGYAEQGPYDAIVIGGAVGDIPAVIAEQLAEGGRLAAVVSGGRMGKGMRMVRRAGLWSRRELFDAATPPLPGFAREPTFSF